MATIILVKFLPLPLVALRETAAVGLRIVSSIV
jgi:hypothetical protein